MKYKISFQLIIICSVAMLAACSTPSELLHGAKFSALQLSLLQTELNLHTTLSNQASQERKQRIIRSYHDDFDLSNEVEDQLYISGTGAETIKLIKIIKRFEKRNNDLNILTERETTRLGGLTDELKISTDAFSKTQNALTDLATEETISEQFNFFLNYALDVQGNFEAQRKATEEKEPGN